MIVTHLPSILGTEQHGLQHATWPKRLFRKLSVFTGEILWNTEAISNCCANANVQHRVHIVPQRIRKLFEKVSVYFPLQPFVRKVCYFKAFECCIMEKIFEAVRIHIKISYCIQDTLRLGIHCLFQLSFFLCLSSLTHIIMPAFSYFTGNYPLSYYLLQN